MLKLLPTVTTRAVDEMPEAIPVACCLGRHRTSARLMLNEVCDT